MLVLSPRSVFRQPSWYVFWTIHTSIGEDMWGLKVMTSWLWKAPLTVFLSRHLMTILQWNDWWQLYEIYRLYEWGSMSHRLYISLSFDSIRCSMVAVIVTYIGDVLCSNFIWAVFQHDGWVVIDACLSLMSVVDWRTRCQTCLACWLCSSLFQQVAVVLWGSKLSSLFSWLALSPLSIVLVSQFYLYTRMM